MVSQEIALVKTLYTFMLHNTKIKGITTELQCQIAFTQLGYNVSVPISEECKYDFIADVDGILLKIQVKTCREEENGIEISLKSTHLSSQGSISHSYTKKDIDAFATYYNDKCYLIPIERCGNTSKKLLFEKNSLSQTGDILNDFTIEKVISKLSTGEEDEEKEVINLKNVKFAKEVIKIYQYSLDGELLNVYPTFSDASRAIGVSKGGSHISEAASGKRKTAYGFIWKVVKEEE